MLLPVKGLCTISLIFDYKLAIAYYALLFITLCRAVTHTYLSFYVCAYNLYDLSLALNMNTNFQGTSSSFSKSNAASTT